MGSSIQRQWVFLGPPGSGKGTQAKALAGVLGVPHISTGDLFRAAVAAQGELGRQVAGLLKAGHLVPDEVTNQVIAERLAQPDVSNGFVLDGYPRNLAQAEFLASRVPDAHALFIELPDVEAIRRIAGRRTCSQCGAIYHFEYKPPKVADVCDVCSGQLIQRNDETEAVVRDRLVIYHHDTEPIVQYYRALGRLTVIDGAPAIEQVRASIRRALQLA